MLELADAGDLSQMIKVSTWRVGVLGLHSSGAKGGNLPSAQSYNALPLARGGRRGPWAPLRMPTGLSCGLVRAAQGPSPAAVAGGLFLSIGLREAQLKRARVQARRRWRQDRIVAGRGQPWAEGTPLATPHAPACPQAREPLLLSHRRSRGSTLFGPTPALGKASCRSHYLILQEKTEPKEVKRLA